MKVLSTPPASLHPHLQTQTANQSSPLLQLQAIKSLTMPFVCKQRGTATSEPSLHSETHKDEDATICRPPGHRFGAGERRVPR